MNRLGKYIVVTTTLFFISLHSHLVFALPTPTPSWRGVFGTISPGPMGDLNFGKIIAWIFAMFFVGIAMFALYSLLRGAFDWVGSGGDEKKLATARQTIMNAMIGLVLSIALIAGWFLLTGSILKIFSADGQVNLPFIN